MRGGYNEEVRQEAWKTAALAAGCLLLAVAAAWSALGQQADQFAYDFLLWLRPPAARPASAVVVALDEPTLRTFGSMAHLRRPLTRVLEVIARSDARAVAVDIQLPDLYDPVWDLPLGRALAATPNLVLASNLVQGAWEDPRPEFSRHAVLGHVHADPDRDGVSRQVLLAKAGAGRRRWALALEAFRLASGGAAIVESEDGLEIGGVAIPATRAEQRAVRIRYLPKDGIERISVKDLIERPETAARLRGRAVFLGVTVQGGPDRLMTPYSFGEAMPGVEIHAHLYETLARGEFLRSAPDSATLALAGAIAAALAVCFWRLSGMRAFLAGFGVLALAHAIPVLLFARNVVLPAATPVAASWFCLLGLGARHHLLTRRTLKDTQAQRNRYQQAIHYVTHELRTPLTAIQGSSELMGRYTLSEDKRKEIAGLIHRESRRLARMVEMFLSVERLSAGQLQLKREPVPAGEVIQSCLERARPLAEPKQIRLRFEEPSGDELTLLGDREFLEYACYNLITNAVKYSPASTEIVVRVERTGETVRLTVADQGYGMDEQEVRRVFQRFYRTRRAEQSGEAGTGLGLALVEEIVVGHGGSIEVASRINEGSRFTLVLPRAAARVGV